MGNPLQDRRTAAEFASSTQVIEITEQVSSFPGLCEIVEEDLAALTAGKIPATWRDRTVRGELQFGYQEGAGDIPTVTGSAAVKIDAVCQRCLEPFRTNVRIEPKLLLVKQQEAADEWGDYEVWELDEDMLRPLDIVEELLIMALPLSAMHDNMADCKALASIDESVEETKRPFADLASQIERHKKGLDS